MNGRIIRFLLVEDDIDHADLIRDAIDSLRMQTLIDHVVAGDEALDYLHHRGRYIGSPRPDVVLLDLKLPRVDGLEVLERAKSDEQLRSIPIVMLTTSDAESDRLRACQNHANSYLVKPVDDQSFARMMADLSVYGSRWNEPPAGRRAA